MKRLYKYKKQIIDENSIPEEPKFITKDFEIELDNEHPEFNWQMEVLKSYGEYIVEDIK